MSGLEPIGRRARASQPMACKAAPTRLNPIHYESQAGGRKAGNAVRQGKPYGREAVRQESRKAVNKEPERRKQRVAMLEREKGYGLHRYVI